MRPIKRFPRAAIVLGLLVLTPLTFSPGDGLQDNTVCSEEQAPDCIREIDSVCTAGDDPMINYYHKADSQ